MKALEYMTYAEYLQTDHWKGIRAAALWFAGERCQLCGGHKDLQVHHNNYNCLGHERPEDLVVLCDRCHELYEINKIPALPAEEIF